MNSNTTNNNAGESASALAESFKSKKQIMIEKYLEEQGISNTTTGYHFMLTILMRYLNRPYAERRSVSGMCRGISEECNMSHNGIVYHIKASIGRMNEDREAVGLEPIGLKEFFATSFNRLAYDYEDETE